MADYSQAKYDYDVMVANEKAESAGATTQAVDLNTRRITTTGTFATGGIVFGTQTPKVEHKAHFESAGTQFTVAEIQQGLIKIGAKHPAKFAILSWADFFDPDMKYETSKDAQVCVVTWEN